MRLGIKRDEQDGPHHRSRRRQAIAWTALLVTALGLRVGLAIHSPSIFHPDEIFQTLEPAHRLAYGYGVATWEWRTGVRSWIFPAFLAAVMRATDWMGPGATGYEYGSVVVLSIISLSSVWFSFMWAKRASGSEAAIIAAGASAIFFEMIYFAPKALTEVVATHALLPGLYLGVYCERFSERKRLFLAGVLCGLASSMRIQLIPTVAFALAYFCYPRWRQRSPAVLAGLSIPVLLFGLVDKFTWSYPWQSFYRYFHANLIEGRSLTYGVEPWYWYLPVLVTLLGPVVLFVFQGAARSPFLATVLLIILGSHSLVSHKEIRFIYPVIPLAIVLASIGFVGSLTGDKTHLGVQASSKWVIACGLLFFGVSSALVASEFSEWCKVPGAQIAFDQLSLESTLCGTGLYEVSWWKTGGYTHLHRNVPIVPVSDGPELVSNEPMFNALVAPLGIPSIPPEFKMGECWSGICVYRRAGACKASQSGSTLNDLLRRTGN